MLNRPPMRSLGLPSGRPVLASLVGYRPAWIKGDVAAGLAIAAVGLPTAIAYPAIAGLPPETGLYASIAPLVACAVFGPSRQLIVGPDAATITVMAAVLATIPGLAAADRPAVAAMLAKINIKVDLQTMPKAQYWQRFDERAGLVYGFMHVRFVLQKPGSLALQEVGVKNQPILQRRGGER